MFLHRCHQSSANGEGGRSEKLPDACLQGSSWLLRIDFSSFIAVRLSQPPVGRVRQPPAAPPLPERTSQPVRGGGVRGHGHFQRKQHLPATGNDWRGGSGHKDSALAWAGGGRVGAHAGGAGWRGIKNHSTQQLNSIPLIPAGMPSATNTTALRLN